MKDQDRPTATRGIDPAEARLTDDAASAAVSAVEPRSGGKAGARDRTRRMRARHGPVKILFFAASTADDEPLALGDEFRAIKQAIRVARHRDALELIPVLATRRSDVQEELLEHSPEIVHFACHGSSKAEILLRGDGPGAEPMTAESLRLLFGVLRDNVVLVVFNACYASAQAAAIREVAGLAIGMRERVENTAATAFAAALYGALASGSSVHDALEVGKAAMDERQGRLPELFARSGVDSHAVYLARAPRRRIGLAVVAGAVACGAPIAAGAALAGRKASGPRPVRGTALLYFCTCNRDRCAKRSNLLASGTNPHRGKLPWKPVKLVASWARLEALTAGTRTSGVVPGSMVTTISLSLEGEPSGRVDLRRRCRSSRSQAALPQRAVVLRDRRSSLSAHVGSVSSQVGLAIRSVRGDRFTHPFRTVAQRRT
jgi:CHAT domain